MSTKILCGPCGYEDNIKNAKKWCTNCEEGFCEDCEKVHRSTKMSRNHTLISVSDYQKIKDVSISQTCIGHGKRYDLYCSVHDTALCIDCVDRHKSCSQLVSLDKAAANAKQSTALADLEDTINGALTNVGRCIKNQEMIGNEFDKKESLIKKNIQETREKLNQHLDLLEKKLIQNLSTKTYNCKSAYAKILNHLNLADQKLCELKEELETMKQMASDVQVFLGTREINKTVYEEIKSFKGIINSSKYFEIKIDIDSSITSIFRLINQFGKISLIEKKIEFEFKDVKLDQAQKQIHVPTGSSNRVVDLHLKQRIRIEGAETRICMSGCLILPNGNILIAYFVKGKSILEYDGQGQYVRNISCSDQPYDLTLIDPDRIAVTYFQKRSIEIINLSNAHVQEITTINVCHGISYEDGQLFVVEDSIGIVVLDLSGKILYIVSIDTKNLSSIATSKDRIYYTTEYKNTIHSLSLRGEEIWKYQNESITSPIFITVADNQDVFVVGSKSNTLSIIKQNGQESKILLHRTGDWKNPRAVYYSKDRKELIVCSAYGGTAAVYKVMLG